MNLLFYFLTVCSPASGPGRSPCQPLGQRHSPRAESVNGQLWPAPAQHRLHSHLPEGEHTLLGAHDAALQHEEVVVDLPVVGKATLWGEAERVGRQQSWVGAGVTNW